MIKSMNETEFLHLKKGLSGPYRHRDAAILDLMWNTGLRVGECIGLNIADVYGHGNVKELLEVRPETSKAKRGRTIPLNTQAKKAVVTLVEFIERHGFDLTTTAPLIVNRRGWRMTPRTIQMVIAGARDEEVPQAKPHALRHGFALRTLKASGNVRVTQQLLGHAALSSTMVYTAVVLDDLKLAVSGI